MFTFSIFYIIHTFKYDKNKKWSGIMLIWLASTKCYTVQMYVCQHIIAIYFIILHYKAEYIKLWWYSHLVCQVIFNSPPANEVDFDRSATALSELLYTSNWQCSLVMYVIFNMLCFLPYKIYPYTI